MAIRDKVHTREVFRAWSIRNAAHRKAYRKAYIFENREKIRIARRAYREKHKERIIAELNAWRKANPDKVRERSRISRKKLLESNPSVRLGHYLGNRMRKTMRGAKGEKMLSILGCSIADFWLYLESKFESGMTRENYGSVWHVDHIMPCAIFDLTKPEHQKRCFHFSNLQPLFAEDNRAKSDKIVTNQFNLL